MRYIHQDEDVPVSHARQESFGRGSQALIDTFFLLYTSTSYAKNSLDKVLGNGLAHLQEVLYFTLAMRSNARENFPENKKEAKPTE